MNAAQSPLLTSDGHATEGVGYLTIHEYNRFVWAWGYASKLVSFLYSAGRVNSTGETDLRVDSTTAPSTPLESTWLAADEISSHLLALNKFRDEEHAANDKIGQYHAIELGRCVSNAERRWPQEDKPHKIRHMRCGGCGDLTLIFRPPRWEGDETIVNCFCGFRLDESGWEYAAMLAVAELEAAA